MAITPKYNYKQIDRLLKQILFDTASWRYLLESNGSNYIELEFEFVKKQLATAINQVANLMDIDLDPEKLPTEPRTITQNNNLNHDWEQRFLADYKGGALFNGPLFARRSRLFSPFVIF